jgi:hypothetical protein
VGENVKRGRRAAKQNVDGNAPPIMAMMSDAVERLSFCARRKREIGRAHV